MRLNSVLKFCSLLSSDERQGVWFSELDPTAEPWESGPKAPPGREYSSDIIATGLSMLEDMDTSKNCVRELSKSACTHGSGDMESGLWIGDASGDDIFSNWSGVLQRLVGCEGIGEKGRPFDRRQGLWSRR